MAGPHVAGVVALLWSAFPSLSRNIAATKQLLAATANPNVIVGNGSQCGGIDHVPNNHFGWGLVDALAAYNGGPPPPPPSSATSSSAASTSSSSPTTTTSATSSGMRGPEGDRAHPGHGTGADPAGALPRRHRSAGPVAASWAGHRADPAGRSETAA